MSSKAALRRLLIQQRSALSSDSYQQHSGWICQHLQSFLAEQSKQTVLAYYPHRQEPDITPLFANRNYRWGLPRCLPNRQLAWHNWQPGQLLISNAYSIWEPASEAPAIDLQAEMILLIPAVGFDSQGYRLGYGGGYFDRLLAAQPQIMAIGVAFDFALVPELPINHWDIPLVRIYTESGMVVDRTSRAL
jgi:5-formyltetrahydrofolate cyclo-ligase